MLDFVNYVQERKKKNSHLNFLIVEKHD